MHCTTDVVSAENCTTTLVKPSTGAQGSRFVPSYIYFIILTIIASLVSLLSFITLKEKIAEEIKNKKENLSEKEIYLLQKLAGIKNPKK